MANNPKLVDVVVGIAYPPVKLGNTISQTSLHYKGNPTKSYHWCKRYHNRVIRSIAMNTSDLDVLDDNHDLHEIIRQAKSVYETQETIHCPFFKGPVALTSDGFNHLMHKPNRSPRNVNEQRLKLRLLKKALKIIRKSGTVQEYRKGMEKFGLPAKDGFTKMKSIEYWAFHHIVGEKKPFLLRVIVRRVGDGKIHFWSVMPHGKINRQKLYEEGIEEE